MRNLLSSLATLALGVFVVPAVSANTAPVISGVPPATATVGQYWQFNPQFHDDDSSNGDRLTLSITGLPSWLGFSPVTGQLSGIPRVVGSQPRATDNVWLGANLSATDPQLLAAGFDPANGLSYSSRYRVTVYDDNGDAHLLGCYFKRIGQGQYEVYLTFDGQLLSDIAGSGVTAPAKTLEFSAHGYRNGPVESPLVLNLSAFGFSSAVQLHLHSPGNRYGVTRFDGDSQLNYIAQDGVSPQEAAGTLQTRISVSDLDGASASLPTFTLSVLAAVITDHDNDGTPDNRDPDDDNDGVLDSQDAFPFDPNERLDSDLDGIGNNRDDDDDNDGIPDTSDPQPTISASNRKPAIFGIPQGFVFNGSNFDFQPRATDADGDSLRYSISNKPSWASFDPATGRLYGNAVSFPPLTTCGTKTVSASLNFDSRQAPPLVSVFEPSDPQSYNYMISVEVSDELQNNRYPLNLYFVKDALVSDSWMVHLTLNGTDLSQLPGSGIIAGSPPKIAFDSAGQMVTPLLSIVLNGGKNNGISMVLNNDDWFADNLVIQLVQLTQFASKFEVNRFVAAPQSCVPPPDPDWQVRATENIYLTFNLDARMVAPTAKPFHPQDPASYNHRQSVPIVDSYGISHQFEVYFSKHSTIANRWAVNVAIDGVDLSLVNGSGVLTPAAEISFDSVGQPYPSTNLVLTGGDAAQGISSLLTTGASFGEYLTVHWHSLDNKLRSSQLSSLFEGTHFSADGYSQQRARRNNMIEIRVTDSQGNSAALPRFNITVLKDSDSDNDLIGNEVDLDDDNDGIVDGNDLYPLDTDNDGVNNAVDSDDDNDGVADNQDEYPFNAQEQYDSDGDGIGNNADNDDDNDGVIDTADQFPLDPTEFQDHDGDGIGNNADNDDDNDGIIDTADHFPFDPTEFQDHDDDGIGNNADDDDDGDGVLDSQDAFPLDNNESLDTDGDGIGNNADSDDDNDGISDSEDAFPLDSSESLDADGDGIGNNADSDDDNDGISDSEDAFPLDSSESLDTDGDGIGNNADSDDDNDAMPDSYEIRYGFDSLNAADSTADADGDGLDNLLEYRLGSDPTDPGDSQIDSDKDGFGNLEEVKAGTDPLNVKSFPVHLEGWFDLLLQNGKN